MSDQPETVLAMLQARIGRLPAGTRRVVRAAAVYGQTFWQGGVAAILGLASADPEIESGLLALTSAELIQVHTSSRLGTENEYGTEYGFRHALVCDAAYGLLTPSDIITGHRMAGEFLETKVAANLDGAYAAGTREAMSATLAYHYQQAREYEKAVAYYLLAAKHTNLLNLPLERLTHLSAALTALKQLPDTVERQRQHVDILITLIAAEGGYVAAQEQTAHTAHARAMLQTLADCGAAIPSDRLRRAQLDHCQGRIHQYASQSREAIVYYQRVLSAADEFHDPELKLMSLFRMGLSLCYQGRFGKARDLLQQPSEYLLRDRTQHAESIRCIMYYCVALAGSGRCAQALTTMEGCRDAIKQLYLNEQSTIESLGMLMFTVMADWPNTLESAKRNLHKYQAMQKSIGTATAVDSMAWAQSHLGEPAQAMANRQRSVAARAPAGGGFLPDWYEAAEAEILLNAGRPAEALRQAEKVIAIAGETEQTFSHAIAERVWGIALLRLGAELPQAAAHFARSLELSGAGEQSVNSAQTELAWGQALRERGDEAAAQPHLQRAITQLADGGYTYALAQARRIILLS